MANKLSKEACVYRVAYQLLNNKQEIIDSMRVLMIAVDVPDAIEQIKEEYHGLEINAHCKFHDTIHHEIIEDVAIRSVRFMGWLDGCTDKAFANIKSEMMEKKQEVEEEASE